MRLVRLATGYTDFQEYIVQSRCIQQHAKMNSETFILGLSWVIYHLVLELDCFFGSWRHHDSELTTTLSQVLVIQVFAECRKWLLKEETQGHW